MERNQPLVLVDIDGVVNIFDGWIVVRDEWMIEKFGKVYTRREAPAHLRADRANGYSLLLNPAPPRVAG